MRCQSHSSHGPAGFLDGSSKWLAPRPRPFKATSLPVCFKDHKLGLHRGKVENATLLGAYFVWHHFKNQVFLFHLSLILSTQKNFYKIGKVWRMIKQMFTHAPTSSRERHTMPGSPMCPSLSLSPTSHSEAIITLHFMFSIFLKSFYHIYILKNTLVLQHLGTQYTCNQTADILLQLPSRHYVPEIHPLVAGSCKPLFFTAV